MAENEKTPLFRKDFNGKSVSIATGGKKRSNVFKRNADRLRSRHSRSPKQRAGTPEPEQKGFTDDSERDTSDGETLSKLEKLSKKNLEKKLENDGIRRCMSKIDKQNEKKQRSRSLERACLRETESEDDFETIRNIHTTKKLEEEKRETEKTAEDFKRKSEEGIKKNVLKAMPPLIVAPKQPVRRRHQSLPSEDFFTERKLSDAFTQKLNLMKQRSKTPEKETKENHVEKKQEEADALNFQKIVFKSSPEDIIGKAEKENEEENKCKHEKISSKRIPEDTVRKKSWFFPVFFFKSNKSDKVDNEKICEKVKNESDSKRIGKNIEAPFEIAKQKWLITEIFKVWRAHVNEHRDYIDRCEKLKNRCITDLILLLFLCGFGGMIFRFTEGAFESFYKCGVKRVKRDFIDTLWKFSQYMLEEDWKSQARRRLMEFENQLHSAHEAGMTTYSGQKSWSFLNAVVYCLTVVTTIGYGHISPSTTTGRAITIVYAIFGIPMFLILLADFGKLFTRGIKFLWAFVRRLYYTGSCRKMRKTAPVQEMMKGVQIMYDFAKTRKFSTDGLGKEDHHLKPPENFNLQGVPETPGTPNWSTFEIDDEFNLPISVAISILLIYIFFGAFLYWMWEDWSFFESFYFVFISMSTIGFGDFVPQHPIYMMLSIIYLVFGLALTSMCINVVQEKLSDTFRQASAKLGTTIGLSIEEPIIIPQNMETNAKK